METYIDPLTPERRAYLTPFSPHARFVIPSDKTGWEYPNWLKNRMIEMLDTHQNGENARYLRSFDRESGRESGIGYITISGRILSGCKLYWYDGDPTSTPCSWEMGMLLRDHEDTGVYKVDEIFLIADAFAE